MFQSGALVLHLPQLLLGGAQLVTEESDLGGGTGLRDMRGLMALPCFLEFRRDGSDQGAKLLAAFVESGRFIFQAREFGGGFADE